MQNSKYYIYIVKSDKNEVYIGSTTRFITERIREHEYKKTGVLYNILRGNFTIKSMVYYNTENMSVLDFEKQRFDREQFFIEYYQDKPKYILLNKTHAPKLVKTEFCDLCKCNIVSMANHKISIKHRKNIN
jgi:predicted GIY-YIG superfamily endonuclease